MSARHCLRGGPLLIVLAMAALAVVAPAAQPEPDTVVNLDGLQSIPAPPPVSLRPRQVATYGALVIAALLTVLYALSWARVHRVLNRQLAAPGGIADASRAGL